MWNGPIECRLFKFSMVKGAMKGSADGSKQDTSQTGDAGETGSRS
jgi:hypothetical protein